MRSNAKVSSISFDLLNSSQKKQAKQLHHLLAEIQLPELENDCHLSEFPLKVPKHFAKQIQLKNPTDPLLRQILPVNQELETNEHYKKDPVGDLDKNPLPSLIHKYYGRVLLIASPKCDIHCRYCFRRHFPYENQSNNRAWHQAIDYIQADDSIHEVILSGGDPMSLSENVLLKLSQKIESIQHVKTLRIHSRTPVVSPIDAAQKEWLEWAKTTALNIVLVVHCNHPNELSTQTHELFKRYQQAGLHLLNQTVLLRSINDSVDVLEKLSHALFAQSVMPYYLHQLDKVQGAAHFQVADQDALILHQALRERLPGYLVPKLVQEVAGEPFKTPLYELADENGI